MAVFKYPENLDEGEGGSAEYRHFIKFSALARGDTKQSVKNHVLLYLPPDALKSSYTQSFGDTDLGAIGAAINQSVDSSAISQALNPMNNMMSSPINAIKGVLGGAGQVAGELSLSTAAKQHALNSALKKAESVNAGAVAALKKKAGRIVNPHKAVIYQGPAGFRVFNFTFNMSPQNRTEAIMIGKIVQYFKYFMHPGVPQFTQVTTAQQGGGATTQTRFSGGQVGNINSSLTLTYPEEFDIQMFVRTNLETGSTGLGDSTSVKPLFKVKRSVLESLSVDYATSGAPAFITDDGLTTPATTSLTMQFKETELMTKQSIAQGY